MKHGTVLGAITLVLAAAGCTSDPTSSLRGAPARINLSSKVLTVNVGDSVPVTATVVDAQGNPLADVPEATSADPAVVAVIASSGAPLPQGRFFVKGLTFGEGTVTVTGGGVTDSLRVVAYPASVLVTGQPDSLLSGTSVILTATAMSADNQPVAGVPIEWAVDEETIATISATSGESVTVSGFTPGVATLTLTLPGGTEAPVPILVVAGDFTGTFSASADPGEVATATRGAGEPPFDDDTEITIDGVPVFIVGTPTADAIDFMVPPVDAAGPRPIQLANLGPEQLALRTEITIESAGVTDAYEPLNDDPATGPVLANGDIFFFLHGNCTDLGTGFGEPDGDPGAECDDFFTLTNASAATVTVDVELDWNEPEADPDLYITDAAFTEIEDGSVSAHPEGVSIDIPAGETRRVYLNLYEDGGHFAVLLKLSIAGLP